MDWRINMARAGLAGLAWGIAFGGPSLLTYHLQGSPSGIEELGRWGVMLVFVALGYIPVGIVLAIPYAIFLGLWEQWTRPSNGRFLAGSVFLSALCGGIPAAWYWYVAAARSYGPDGGFTGPQRLAVVGFTTWLVVGYVVGRCLPQTGDNPVGRAYDKYAVALWIGLFWGLFMAPAIFFPVFGMA